MKAETAGVIEAVVRAISAHIDNADVCIQGCCALRNMVSGNGKSTDKNSTMKQKWTDENKLKAEKEGGIEVIMNAINTHIDNPNVREQGCSTLWNMVSDNGKSTDKNSTMKWNE